MHAKSKAIKLEVDQAVVSLVDKEAMRSKQTNIADKLKVGVACGGWIGITVHRYLCALCACACACACIYMCTSQFFLTLLYIYICLYIFLFVCFCLYDCVCMMVDMEQVLCSRAGGCCQHHR